MRRIHFLLVERLAMTCASGKFFFRFLSCVFFDCFWCAVCLFARCKPSNNFGEPKMKRMRESERERSPDRQLMQATHFLAQYRRIENVFWENFNSIGRRPHNLLWIALFTDKSSRFFPLDSIELHRMARCSHWINIQRFTNCTFVTRWGARARNTARLLRKFLHQAREIQLNGR